MKKLITTTNSLKGFCKLAVKSAYVTIDTEFLRDRTYFPKLCLIQMAFPGDGNENAALIDAQSTDLDLTPLYEIFESESIVKVFHAARQDLEIFFLATQKFPKPFFDTQIAAMVCGFGEQVGYETLVRRLTSKSIDKSSRFSDWSKRPLSEDQINYALGDVTHLRDVYEKLIENLNNLGRSEWFRDELQDLLKPENYFVDPEDAWKRIKIKSNNQKFLSAVKFLAFFREEQAKCRNIPRNRILKDEMILELASIKPKSLLDLGKSRLLNKDARRGWIAEGIIGAFKKANESSLTELPPVFEQTISRKLVSESLLDLLKVLLKAKSEETGVAARLVATNQDLELLVTQDSPDIPALHGWRKTIFGNDAIRLKNGEIALSAKGSGIEIIPLKKSN